jgi:3-isopropylmalate/(R)-2-methylmalate dehydratase large subunit
MRITISGKLNLGVTPKDVALFIISKLTTSGATGYVGEYAGEVFRDFSMEGRMTVCNLSIEMGARGGMIAPDKKTFEYVKEREFTPKNNEWNKEELETKISHWKTLPTDDDAVFDKEYTFDAADIGPMITYGTNPGMGIRVDEQIPTDENESYQKALDYMGFSQGDSLHKLPINYVFIGSCTNSRIEDFRAASKYIKGKKKASNVNALIVPGSQQVAKQIQAEGLHKIFEAAGFEIRQPGCSACLAMNDDKIPAGEYCVSTSNRNFEGRQGPGARTILASPMTAAAAAIEGKIVDITQL